MPPKKTTKTTKKKPTKKPTKKKPTKTTKKKSTKKSSKKEEIEEENDLSDNEDIGDNDNDGGENSNSDSDNFDDEDIPEEDDEDDNQEDDDDDEELEEAEELFQEDYNLLLTQKDIDENPDNKLDNFKMSIYEKTRLIGTRSKQISTGAKPFIKTNDKFSSRETAEKELDNRTVPIELIRKMPNGTQEVWKINQFN